MGEPTWTPERGEEGVRWTLDAFNAAVLDLMTAGFSLEQARALASVKRKADGETDDEHESR